MNVFKPNDIRNVALAGHSASGKTTLIEAILYTLGVTSRMGKIDEGNTRSDYFEDEKSRRISINTSLLQMEWQSHKLNILDTPGYADFVGEVIAALRAVDTTAVCIDSLTGLDVGTETVWDLCDKYNRPRFFTINRVGKEHANAPAVLKSVQDRFGIKALPVQIPVNPGVGFNRIIDIISMKEYTYELNGKGIGKENEISADYQKTARELHEKLIEAAAESDDKMMEKFFESGLTPEEVSNGIRQAIAKRVLLPIVFTDGYTNVGTDLLLKLIVEGLPSPADMPPVKAMRGKEAAELAPSENGPLAMLVFKTIIEQHVGELSLFRIFSGTLTSGEEIYNVTRSASEKTNLIYAIAGNERTEVTTLTAGDIGGFVKMKNTKTSDTLSTKNAQVSFPPLEFPEPVMDVAVYPTTKGEDDKISQGLTKLNEEDPSFKIIHNPELKQIILAAQGGMHVDVIMDRFKRKNNVGIELKAPKIPYRETITGSSDERYRFKKQTGGRGQYGEVYFRMEPTPRGFGYEFLNEIKGGVIPSRFVPAVEKGIKESMEEGPLSHSKVIDLRIALYYGSYHAVDSSEQAFKMAASMCFRECFLKAKPILLEPIYDIEVKVPDQYTGDVMGDLSSKRGKIMGMEPSGIFQVVKAQIPLSELYMYSTHLRSLTNGRGNYARKFSNYEIVPPEIAQKVIEATKKEEQE